MNPLSRSIRTALCGAAAALALGAAGPAAFAQLTLPSQAGPQAPRLGTQPALPAPGSAAPAAAPGSPSAAPRGPATAPGTGTAPGAATPGTATAAPGTATATPGTATAAPAAAATAPRSSSRQPLLVDRIVAVVNNEVITARELDERIRLVEGQLKRRNVENPPRDVLERQVLERMILDRAQVQLAKESGIRVDEQLVDRAMARMAEQSGLTVTQFRDRIERDGVPFARFREDMRDDILLTRLREREVDAKVQVSEAEIDAFLAENAGGAAAAGGEFLVSQILLRVPEGASPEQIERQRARAEELARQAREGADFARLAAANSDAPEALSGGSLGWRPAERLPQLFVDAVARLAPGTVAPVVKSANGFHVLRLDDKRQPQGAALAGPVTQTKARHILVRINERIDDAEAKRRLAEIRQRVQAGAADFADMARQYSADGSAGRGGDLGWVYAGDTVPEFERAMDALKPGEISEPVRTPFGWHLIQVLDRRTDEASPERVRQAARQAVRERKIDEAYADWARQLRDRTYVEYRAE